MAEEKYASMSAELKLDNKKFLKEIERSARATERMGRKLKSVGSTLSRSLSAPLLAVAAISSKFAIDFEAQMKTVAAVSGASAKELKSLSNTARRLGRDTVFTAKEVGQLQENLARLGFSAPQINVAAESILALAQATGIELADAAEIAGQAVRQMGLDVEQTSQVADVFALVTARSAANMAGLRESMAEFGPIAASMGLSLEATAALIGKLADAGISGSKAGTALKAIYVSLSEKGRTFTDVLSDVRDGTIGVTEATELVGRRGLPALLALADLGENEIKTLAYELENSAGAASAMAAVMDNSLAGTLKRTRSALESAAIELGNEFGPVVEKLATLVQRLAQAFVKANPFIKTMIKVFLTMGIVIGPLVLMFGAFAIVLSKVRTEMAAAATAMNRAIITEASLAVVTGANTTATFSFAAAWKALTAAMASNPFGAIAVGIATLLSVLVGVIDMTVKATSVQETYDKGVKAGTAAILGQQKVLNKLVEEMTDENTAMNRKKVLAERIKELTKDNVDFTDDLTVATDSAKKAVQDYTDALLVNARVMAARNLLTDKQEQLLLKEQEIEDKQKEVDSAEAKIDVSRPIATGVNKEGLGVGMADVTNAAAAARDRKDELAELNEEKEAINKEMEFLLGKIVEGEELLKDINLNGNGGIVSETKTPYERLQDSFSRSLTQAYREYEEKNKALIEKGYDNLNETEKKALKEYERDRDAAIASAMSSAARNLIGLGKETVTVSYEVDGEAATKTFSISDLISGAEEIGLSEEQRKALQAAYEERLRMEAKFYEDLNKQADDRYRDTLSERDKDEYDAAQRFDRRVAMAGENHAMLLAAEETYLQELADINDRYENEALQEKLGKYMNWAQQFSSTLVNAFVMAQDQGEKFGKSIVKSIGTAIKALLVKVIGLTIAFAALLALMVATGFADVSSFKEAASLVGGFSGFQDILSGDTKLSDLKLKSGTAPTTGGNNNLSLVVRGTDLHTAQDGAARGFRRLYG